MLPKSSFAFLAIFINGSFFKNGDDGKISLTIFLSLEGLYYFYNFGNEGKMFLYSESFTSSLFPFNSDRRRTI
jgi:hypothetical protein